MIGLKPYPEYKDSGVPWLGEVPSNWNTFRTKTQFRLSVEKSGSNHGQELLSIYTHIGVRPRKELEQRGNKATTTDDYWVVRKGDIISNKLLAWMGAIGVSHYDGVTSPAYDILTPITKLESNYYHYLFRTKLYGQVFKMHSRGMMEMRLRLYFDQFGRIPLLCPPVEEQAAIVRFLDYVDRRIRRYIRLKQKMIGLLEEQKQAIIHRAVTRGLNPDVPLKPSGIDWLGDVPEHWEVWQFGRMGRFSKGNGGTKIDEVPEGIPCIRYGDLYMHYKFFIRECRSYVTRERAVDYTPIQYGDILFAGSGETIEEIGKSAVNLIKSEVVCGGDVILYRPSINVEPLFIGYAADCPQAVYQKACMGRGITVMHIYENKLKYMWIALPPLPEQAVIVEYLNKTTTNIDAAISRTRREIELLSEYRTRLIADVVTGKLDVRTATANLSDKAEKSELLDESDDGLIEEVEEFHTEEELEIA